MLILYFHIFQRGFEVSNAIFQACVYVTIVTAIVYYNSTTVRKTLDILSLVELLIYSRTYFLIKQNKNYSSISKSIIIASLIDVEAIRCNNVDTTLYQCCATVKIWRRIFFQRWSTSLKQRWSDVKILAGLGKTFYLIKS